MTAPFIVGLGHMARAGKDTAAEAIVRDLRFERMACADPLRDIAMMANPLVTSTTRTVNVGIGRGKLAWVVQSLGYEAAKNTYPEVRTFLENLGLGMRQVIGEEVFIDALLRRAERSSAPGIVVPDVRYLNEAEAIQAAGGVVIRINRPGRAEPRPTDAELKDWDGWDREFDNTSTTEVLQTAVVDYVRSAMKAVEA